MHKVILKGEDALHYAEAHDIHKLRLVMDELGNTSRDVDLSAARDEMKTHPEHVWLEIDTWINSSE